MRSTEELKVWTPRLKIREAVSDKEPKRLEKIQILSSSKTIIVNQDVMEKLTCPMDFDKFPFDIQTCDFSMFDALNHANTLVFVDKTKYENGISASKYNVEVERLNYTSGWKGHSMIGFNLILTRTTHIYLASIYLPSVMFVVMSWLR